MRGSHRPGSGPAMRSRFPEEEGADPGAIPVAGQVLSRSAAFSVRRGAFGAPARRARRGQRGRRRNA